MTPEVLRDHVVDALEDRKGQDILVLDVRRLTSVSDFMVIATGTSNRHVKALVDAVADASAQAGTPPLGVEGTGPNEWVLVDLGDVVVHVMQRDARGFYDLERLWTPMPASPARDNSRLAM
ncbi:MAG: ribosome silencing factor [Candidatus Nanopelagicales bacterium]